MSVVAFVAQFLSESDLSRKGTLTVKGFKCGATQTGLRESLESFLRKIALL